MELTKLKERLIDVINEYEDERPEYEGLTVTQMREYLGLNKTQFAKKYDIPSRTLDAWESGERTPAPYVLKLLERIVKEDKR